MSFKPYRIRNTAYNYSRLFRTKDKIIENKQVGHMLRTKLRWMDDLRNFPFLKRDFIFYEYMFIFSEFTFV